MSQMTWRASDDLVAQVKAAAAREGCSLNEFVTRVMTAVVDPGTADGELAVLQERLSRAGILELPAPVAERPDPILVATARRELSRGNALASDAHLRVAAAAEGFVPVPTTLDAR